MKTSADKINKKMRVNITIDRELLEKAKTKLHLFGGKLSTLFNAYLKDFVQSMDKKSSSSYKELEERIKKLEEKFKK